MDYKSNRTQNIQSRFLRNLRLLQQKDSNTNDFFASLRFATDADERRLFRKDIFGRVVEEASPSMEYVGVQYQEPGSNSYPRNMYLVRYGRQGDDKIFGAELDDGRSLTAQGTEKFLKDLVARGGTVQELDNSRSVRDVPRANQNAKQGAIPYKPGVIEALNSLRRGL